jgi:hypothetical protein
MLTEGVLLFFTGERERELVGGRRDGRRKRGKDKVSDQRRELDRPLSMQLKSSSGAFPSQAILLFLLLGEQSNSKITPALKKKTLFAAKEAAVVGG